MSSLLACHLPSSDAAIGLDSRFLPSRSAYCEKIFHNKRLLMVKSEYFFDVFVWWLWEDTKKGGQTALGLSVMDSDDFQIFVAARDVDFHDFSFFLAHECAGNG